MRHSIAWPRGWMRSCRSSDSGSPAAMLDLLAHEIEPGHHLGHRVLDLDAGVHLHEVEAAVARPQELERADVRVADRVDRLAPHAAGSFCARLVGAARATAPPRSPSGGGAGSSTRARRGARRCRACRRRPGSRCGAAPRRSARCRRRGCRSRPAPRCAPVELRSSSSLFGRGRSACRARRRRRSP